MMSLAPWARRIAGLLGLRLVPVWVGDALMTIIFALIWVDPLLFGPDMAADLNPLIMFEFLAIHSTPFIMIIRAGKLPPVARWGLLIYVPFAVAVGSMMSSWFVTVLFFWHLAGALWHDGSTDAEFDLAIARYVIVATVFILLPFVLWLVPMPDLGWTADVIPADAVWSRAGEPDYSSVPAWGTLYFVFRTAWHIMFWYLERTGVRELSPPTA